MDVSELNSLYTDAKDDPEAREKLIQICKNQIALVASGIAGRSLTWENDDELSISLIAFNEAIETYDPSKGKSFWGYANIVIRNRLLDYFRRETIWKKRIALTAQGDGVNPEVLQKETELAWRTLREEEEAREGAEMVISFEKALLQFKISLIDLTKSSPKHQDTRATLIRVATTLAKQEDLVSQLMVSKQLPIKELMLLTGQSRKVLERGRRYIVALVLILTQPEFSPMKTFLQLPEEVKV